MIAYEQTPHWRLFAGRFLFTDVPQWEYINLAPLPGEAMRYGKTATTQVDFPGEYDIAENSVVCFESGGLLHYQLLIDEQVVVIIQSPALLEKETLWDVDVGICTNEECKHAIERDELEGEIVVLA